MVKTKAQYPGTPRCNRESRIELIRFLNTGDGRRDQLFRAGPISRRNRVEWARANSVSEVKNSFTITSNIHDYR